MGVSGSGDSGNKEVIADTVKQLINNHKVMVFSKTYCILLNIFR